MSSPWFSTTWVTCFDCVSYLKSDVGPLRSDRKYTALPIHIGLASFDPSRGTRSMEPSDIVASQISDASPPRYRFQISLAGAEGMYASRFPSAENEPA